MRIYRTVTLIVLILLALIGATMTAVKLTTDHLLYEDATDDARAWARYVTFSVKDLEQIGGGEEPSRASMTFFQWSQENSSVFRFEIFNREGYSQLVSDRHGTALVDVSEFNADAARAIRSMEPIVAVRDGTTAVDPSFLAEAYMPVLVDGRPIAAVAAFLDETKNRDRFSQTFLLATGSLCLLTALAFVVPAAAWYRRTREKQHADDELMFLAKHDGMTRLVNRVHLTERLNETLIQAAAVGAEIAVHYLDLDRFKEVNDTLGHQGGDTMIKLMAERLRASTRSSDIVARLGGDEFAVVQTIGDRSDAEGLAQRLLAAMAKPFPIEGHDIATSASIGIALAPQDGNDAERLLKSADLALYKSKADGRNCASFFTPDMDTALQARLSLERCIRATVKDEGFHLYFQPLVDASGSSVTGFEALLRMRGEDGDLIPPATFIPVAEEMGLIGKIGAWVIRKACLSAAPWPEHLTIAVNLSPSQFDGSGLCDTVAAALAESGLAPGRLELEITESLLLHDTDAIIGELHQLKALGVAIVMDDFGSGYSSLSYLWRFPFDKIKIDRTFMQGLDTRHKSVETIIKTITDLGHALHMSVTVEGVEDGNQAQFVRDIDGDQMQGFYFGRPMPEEDIPGRMLEDSRRALSKQPAAAEPRLRAVQ
ncbi:MAG: EAL domain-containing protein [Xanthobacteraceae bacterium]